MLLLLPPLLRRCGNFAIVVIVAEMGLDQLNAVGLWCGVKGQRLDLWNTI